MKHDKKTYEANIRNMQALQTPSPTAEDFARLNARIAELESALKDRNMTIRQLQAEKKNRLD
jgi:hypothetical protein